MTISVTIEGRNAGLDGLGVYIDGGVVDSYIRFYDGALPTNVATALAGNNLIVESTMSATAFATAASGAMSANAIPQVVIAASGMCSGGRIVNYLRALLAILNFRAAILASGKSRLQLPLTIVERAQKRLYYALSSCKNANNG